MTRRPFVSLLIIAATAGVGIAVAAEERPAVLTPAPEAAAAKSAPTSEKPRAISPTTAAHLAAAAPKFQPAPAKPAESTEPPPDLREIDKPRNAIIRLPRYLVEEDKPTVLKERTVMTPQARLDLALKKHPGLRFG